jgi:hypothetical protein
LEKPIDDSSILLQIQGQPSWIGTLVVSVVFICISAIYLIGIITGQEVSKDDSSLVFVLLLLFTGSVPILYQVGTRRLKLILTEDCLYSLNLWGLRTLRYTDIQKVGVEWPNMIFYPKRSTGDPKIQVNLKHLTKDDVQRLFDALTEQEDRYWRASPPEAVQTGSLPSSVTRIGSLETRGLRYRLDVFEEQHALAMLKLTSPFAWLGKKFERGIGGRWGRVLGDVVYYSGAYGLIVFLTGAACQLMFYHAIKSGPLLYFLYLGVAMGSFLGILSGLLRER